MSVKSLFVVTLLLSSLPASPQGIVALKGTFFETVAVAKGLDPLLLYAVALTESAIAVGKSNIRPYPYVFRTRDGPQYFGDRETAESALREALQTTRHVDVGMMQVNLYYHPQSHPLRLLDAKHNLVVAADILKQAMASTPDPVVGVGRYHSWKSAYSAWYGERVWATYRNLKE